MNQIFSKFSLYDQLGYLLVGTIALLVTYLDSFLIDIRFPDFSLANVALWIVAGYFLGHIIQAISNLLIKEEKENFSEKENDILNIAKNYFKLEKISSKEVWNLCYMLALSKDKTGQINAFNGYYSLYRGWNIVFAFETIFLIGLTIYSFTFLKIFLIFVSLIITILFHLRLKRFKNYLREKVLQVFIMVRAFENKVNK